MAWPKCITFLIELLVKPVVDPVQDGRRMAKFMQYAIVAAQEALDDAGWHPESPRDQDMTVRSSAIQIQSA